MKHIRPIQAHSTGGFTLVETLIAMTLVLIMVLAIIPALAQQSLTTRYSNDRQMAVAFAESKMEEYMKYPAKRMVAGTTVDYIVRNADRQYLVSTSDPDRNGQFRREVQIASNGSLCTVTVRVQYGKKNTTYPFSITLRSQRGG